MCNPSRAALAAALVLLAAPALGAPAPAGPGATPPPRPFATSLTLNAAAPLGNPFADGYAWRAEVGLERRIPRSARWSSAALLGAGQVRSPGHPTAGVFEVAGQFRWYGLGSFQRGAYVGGQLAFWRLGPHLAWSPGALVGLKLANGPGPTVDVHLCAQWPVDWLTAEELGNRVPFREAWRTMMPGLFVGIGWSPPIGPSARRVRPSTPSPSPTATPTATATPTPTATATPTSLPPPPPPPPDAS